MREEDIRRLLLGASIGASSGLAMWLLRRHLGAGNTGGDAGLPSLPSAGGERYTPAPATVCKIPGEMALRSACKPIRGIPCVGCNHEREKFILDAVQTKQTDPVTWVPITSTERGHTATFYVMADGLKINGVRMSATPATHQMVADMLGASLLTPKLVDLIYQQAKVRLRPVTIMPATSDTETLIQANDRVNDAIVKKSGTSNVPADALVANAGKHWVLSDRLIDESITGNKCNPGVVYPVKRRATNYGWNVPLPDPLGKQVDTPGFTVDGKKIGVYQSVGACHDLDHADYSQIIQLVKNECFVDGQFMTLQRLLRHPELAWLASNKGPIQALRLPGVPPVSTV